MDVFTQTLTENNLERCENLNRANLTTLQVNLGNLCNLACKHCHIEASPKGRDNAGEPVIRDILGFLARYKIRTLDITGGAPEMNPYFEHLIEKGRGLVDELIVRSNLTILLEDEKNHLLSFYKKHKVRLVCSLPCYLEKNVDAQRGSNVFKESIAALQKLNAVGYGIPGGEKLDLVYNPVGPNLPPAQKGLEDEYKRVLRAEYGIEFNRLMTITNVAIKRFKRDLERRGQYEQYRRLLVDNFNPNVIENLMCRTFLSVGFDGKLYDCDFNLALGLALKDEHGNYLTLKDVSPPMLLGRQIITGEHCLACTAGCGSSCQGALAL